MTIGHLAEGVVRRLEKAGYRPAQTPFHVASVEFEFTAALIGSGGRALDLVLIVDTATGEFGDRDAKSVRQRIEALSRALDVTRSRYLLTAILVGAALPKLLNALSPTCRVLNVESASFDTEGEPISDQAALALDDQIRILLPLTIAVDDEAGTEENRDPIAKLLSALSPDLDQTLVSALTEASKSGEDAVRTALGKVLDIAIEGHGI
jgi:hypothetical protein